MRLYLSDQAYTSIVAETHAHIDTETGGIFLGKFEAGAWYIIEVIDPGYQDILRQVAYFEYDKSYVTHLANVRARLYKNSLSLLGLWHRHPGGFDRFSATDDQTHRLYLRQNPRRGIISSLVNIDPRFRLTHYFIDSAVTHRKITDIHIGDQHIPEKFLALKFSGADALKDGMKNRVTNNDSPPHSGPTDSAARHKAKTGRPTDYFKALLSSLTDKPPQKRGTPVNEKSEMTDSNLNPAIPEATDTASDEALGPEALGPCRHDPWASAEAKDTASDEALETLLALLENELEFLETQSQYDYRYDYDEAAKAINLTLDYTGNAYDAHYYPNQLKCSLFMRGPESYCGIEGAEKPYQQDFIRLHIETILNKKAG